MVIIFPPVEPFIANAVPSSTGLTWSFTPLGLIPIPTFPPLVITKSVLVEEPTANDGPVMPLGLTERSPHGEVVPTPTEPPDVAKYAEPDAVMAVVLAYGNTEAMVEVARYLAAVGVEVETRTPEPLMEASMFVPTLEKVALPSTVRVEVAVTAPPKNAVPDV